MSTTTTPAQLLAVYKSKVNTLINVCNNLIRQVSAIRLTYANKQRYITLYKNQFNAQCKVLNAKYQSDLVKLLNPVSPSIALTKSRKALLIGINYIGTSSQLSGCINDTNAIKNLLLTQSNFAANDITVITDETVQKPTRATILETFTTLLQSGKDGDLLFFSYSGHGSYVLDRNNDETNGNDEMIVAADMKGIIDDELKALIQTYLKKNVTLFALFDSCFSGTVLDLKYQYLDSLENDNFTENAKEETTIGNVIMISGCTDNQTSADAFINNRYQGAMTWAFLNGLKGHTSATASANTLNNITWRDLLLKMRDDLKTSNFTQLPQLSSGCFMNINTPICF